MKVLFLITLISLLSACKSDVDICVDAQVIAWKDRTEKNKKIIADKEKQAKAEGKAMTLADWMDIIDITPELLETEVVAKARIDCQKH